MSKYDPLKRRLMVSGTGVLEMTFAEIAELVGGLPRSAFEHRAWWSNELGGRHVQAHAWLNAGFGTEGVDLARQRVWFRETGT
jgi:hypothetical protein